MPLVSLVLAAAVALSAPLFHRTPQPATATFRVLGPMGFPIVGKTGDVDVVDDGEAVAVVVDLRRLDTGMKLRDDHMRDHYLEVRRFPVTQLRVPRTDLTTRRGGVVDGSGVGQLTLHGVTRPLPFHYRARCTAAEVCDVAAAVELDMNDFGVVVAPYLGMGVERHVTIEVAFQATH